MLPNADEASVFGRDSHVREYWLANAAGFEVRRNSRVCGRVEDVVVDGQLGHATVLLVREPGQRQPVRLPAHRVGAVDPFVKLLYLEDPPRARRPSRVRAVAGAAGLAARRSAPPARRGALAAGAAGRRGWLWVRPRLLELARVTARGALRAAAALRHEVRVLAARRYPRRGA
jgi:hypothetical protein